MRPRSTCRESGTPADTSYRSRTSSQDPASPSCTPTPAVAEAVEGAVGVAAVPGGNRESGRQPVAVKAGPVRPGFHCRAVRGWRRWWRIRRRICRWRWRRRTPGDRESGRQPVAVEAGPVRSRLNRRAVRWWRWWWRIRRRICRWRRWRRRAPGDRESGRQPVAVEARPVRSRLDRRARRGGWRRRGRRRRRRRRSSFR